MSPLNRASTLYSLAPLIVALLYATPVFAQNPATRRARRPTPPPGELIEVQNWTEEMKGRARK